jgi:hypothetical protein
MFSSGMVASAVFEKETHPSALVDISVIRQAFSNVPTPRSLLFDVAV